MKLRWRRLIAGALAAEAIPVFLLILYVFIFGPRDPEGAAAFAEATGVWFGPLVGALVTLFAARIVARGAPGDELRHGLILGVLVAALDATIIVAGGTPFRLLFALSGLGRIAAGALGGWLAAKASAEG